MFITFIFITYTAAYAASLIYMRAHTHTRQQHKAIRLDILSS